MAASLVALPEMQEPKETRVRSLGWEDPLEQGMAVHSSILFFFFFFFHSSILTWRIPWTEEPDGLQSMGLQKVRYWNDLSTHACIWRCTRQRGKGSNCSLRNQGRLREVAKRSVGVGGEPFQAQRQSSMSRDMEVKKQHDIVQTITISWYSGR